MADLPGVRKVNAAIGRYMADIPGVDQAVTCLEPCGGIGSPHVVFEAGGKEYVPHVYDVEAKYKGVHEVTHGVPPANVHLGPDGDITKIAVGALMLTMGLISRPPCPHGPTTARIREAQTLGPTYSTWWSIGSSMRHCRELCCSS